jgi:hypothetical protein
MIDPAAPQSSGKLLRQSLGRLELNDSGEVRELLPRQWARLPAPGPSSSSSSIRDGGKRRQVIRSRRPTSLQDH